MMLLIFILGLSFVLFKSADTFELLQVRKQDAYHSNIDPITHKVVPAPLTMPAHKLQNRTSETRKDFSGLSISAEEKDVHKFQNDTRKWEEMLTNRNLNLKSTRQKSSRIEYKNSTSLSSPLQRPRSLELEPDLKDVFNSIVKKIFRSFPILKSKSEDLLEPQKVRLRSGDSTTVYNVNPDNVASALKDVLSSVTLQKYLDKLTRKAAYMYRAVQSDVLENPTVLAFLNRLLPIAAG